MTTLTDLDQRRTAAWAAYRNATADLAPGDYETAEELAWASLQSDLQGIDGERDGHAASATD
jgi:hypothetical protein